MNRFQPLYSVKLIANGKSHFYELGDDPNWKPGVTTVLGAAIPKPALLPWALNQMGDNLKEILSNREIKPWESGELDTLIKESKNIYKKKSSEAADIGSRVHKTINDIIHGNSVAITPDIEPAVSAFTSWDAIKTLKIELGDTKIGSRVFGYGGSLDMVAFDGNEAIIWDFKTNKKRKDRDHGIYPETAYQLAAYCVAFRETFGIPVKSAYALWLNKEKPEFKAVKISNLDACFEGFLAALKLYNLSKFEKFEED